MLKKCSRSILVAFSLCLVTTVPILSEPSSNPAIEGSQDEWISMIRSYGDRRENTEGERELFSQIEAEANRRSLINSFIPISEYTGEHSFSQILEVRIPGTGPGTLTLVFPMEGEASWGDGAYGIAAAVRLWDRLLENKPPVSVRFSFLGADEELLGSRAYASYLADEASLAILRVEIGGPLKDSAELLFGGTGQLSPYWLLESGIRAVQGEGFQAVVRANRSFLFRMRMTDKATDLDPWFERGIPALTLRIENNGSAVTSGDSLENEVDLLETFLRSFQQGIPDGWDRQYVLFQASKIRISVRETAYIAFVLLIYAILGFVFAMDSMRRRDLLAEDLKTFPRGAVALTVVLISLLICVIVCTSFLHFLLNAIQAPDYWRIAPLIFSVFRLFQLICLFLCVASLLAHFRIIPRRSGFFQASAAVVLGIDVLLLSALSVSLSFMFLWAFIITIAARRLYRRTRRTWPIALALPISFVPLGFVLSELIRSPEYAAFGRFLLPTPVEMAYLCFIALPFLLLFVALGEGVFGPRFYSIRTAVLAGAAFCAVSFAGSAWMAADAFGFRGTAQINVSEYVDEDAENTHIDVSCLRPLPNARLFRTGLDVPLEEGSSFSSTDFPGCERLLTLKADKESFLDRIQVNLTIFSTAVPTKIRIVIPEVITGSVYDCSYPFSATEDGKGIVVSVGVRPPSPLVVSFTVSSDFSGPANVIAEFREPPEALDTEGPIRIVRHHVEHQADILLASKNPFSK